MSCELVTSYFRNIESDLQPDAMRVAFDDVNDTFSESRSAVTRPPFTIGRKIGPSVILAAASQDLMDLIGQATEPGTMAMTVPCPSWSVFDRTIRM